MDALATAPRCAPARSPAAWTSRSQPVPYIFIAPEDPAAIGEIARRVYRKHYSRPWKAGARDLWLLGKILDGGADAMHGELLSYVFFAGEFAEALIQLGRADAQRWIDEHPARPLAARSTTRLEPTPQRRHSRPQTLRSRSRVRAIVGRARARRHRAKQRQRRAKQRQRLSTRAAAASAAGRRDAQTLAEEGDQLRRATPTGSS